MDPDLRVLVLARSHNQRCFLEAMQSGALDYLEGTLGAAEMVALLETFIPRRIGSHRTSPHSIKASRLRKKQTGKGASRAAQKAMQFTWDMASIDPARSPLEFGRSSYRFSL
jgi:DNA-binding NarL/FixJ family response regulator